MASAWIAEIGRSFARSLPLLLVLGLLPLPASGTAASPSSIAVFEFELIDSSLEGELQGPREDEARRLALIGEDLRRRLGEAGRYRLVDMTPARDEIAAAGYLEGCPRCAARIARGLDAKLALTGTVQKVSNLILNINLYLHDAASAKLLRAMSVDIRGNTDESWLHGISYLVRNRFLKDDR